MRISIDHVTHYVYEAPVRYSTQYLRLVPPSNSRQRVVEWRLETPAMPLELRDGHFSVGDLGTIDEAGFITLVDRKHDTIITGGTSSSVPDNSVVTVQFPDNARFAAAARGCTSSAGPMSLGEGTMTFGTFNVDDIGCASPWAETLRVLQAGKTTYAIDAGRLTIMAGNIGISAIAV